MNGKERRNTEICGPIQNWVWLAGAILIPAPHLSKYVITSRFIRPSWCVMFQGSRFVPNLTNFMAVGLQMRSSVLLREIPEQNTGNCGVVSEGNMVKGFGKKNV